MKPNFKKGGLGRGLDQLLGPSCQLSETAGSVNIVSIEKLLPGKYQPRVSAEKKLLEELSVSIKKHGLIQPILVRPFEDKYEIVAGERRYRAAILAGLKSIAVIIRNSNDENAALLALIENIQRQDLTPMETAHGFHRLIKEFNYTHQKIAEMTGYSRSAISNYVRLTTLCPEVQNMLNAGSVSMGHARALLQLDSSNQVVVAKQIIKNSLSVRKIEELVSSLESKKEEGLVYVNKKKESHFLQIEKLLSDKFYSDVKVYAKDNGKGKIIISYNSLDNLEEIMRIMNASK